MEVSLFLQKNLWKAVVVFFSFLVCSKGFAQNIANNNITGNQTVCNGVTPTNLLGSMPTGGSGVYQYLWIASTTNATAGYAAAAGVNNAQNFQPSLLNTTTWYRRLVISGSYTDTSASVQVTFANSLTLSVVGSLNLCPGDSVVLLNYVGGVSPNYQWWKKPQGGSTWNMLTNNSTNYYYSAKLGGLYTLKLTLANGCVLLSDTVTVHVDSTVFRTITTINGTSFCQGNTDTLVCNALSGLSYQWYQNMSLISGATDSFYAATASGSYRLKSTHGSCSGYSNYLYLNAINLNPVVTAAGNTNLCAGNGVVLSASGVYSGYVQWYLGNNIIPGATSTTYLASATGSYKVYSSYASCPKYSTPIQVVVYALPTGNINPLGDTVFCNGDSLLIQAPTGVGYSYQWIRNSGSFGNPTVSSVCTVKTSGVYSCLVYNLAQCYEHTNTVQVMVHPLPFTINQTGNQLSANGFINYQWYYSGNAVAGATDSVFIATQTGYYKVKTTDSMGCSCLSDSIYVFVNGVGGLYQDIAIKIYPNPVADKLMIEGKDVGTIFIENMVGEKLVFTQKTTSEPLEIPTNDFSKGIYFIHFIKKGQDLERCFKLFKE
jgi:hypothetical protein